VLRSAHRFLTEHTIKSGFLYWLKISFRILMNRQLLGKNEKQRLNKDAKTALKIDEKSAAWNGWKKLLNMMKKQHLNKVKKQLLKIDLHLRRSCSWCWLPFYLPHSAVTSQVYSQNIFFSGQNIQNKKLPKAISFFCECFTERLKFSASRVFKCFRSNEHVRKNKRIKIVLIMGIKLRVSIFIII